MNNLNSNALRLRQPRSVLTAASAAPGLPVIINSALPENAN
jgi:hypothetical protein